VGRTACTEPQCLYKGALYLFFNATFVSLLDVLGTNSSSEITVNIPVGRPPVLRADMYSRPQSETQFLHIAVPDADKCADKYVMIYVRSVRLSDVFQCMSTNMPHNYKNSKKHTNSLWERCRVFGFKPAIRIFTIKL